MSSTVAPTMTKVANNESTMHLNNASSVLPSRSTTKIGPTVQLNTGANMPQLAFGTWQALPGQVEKAVDTAVSAGFTHIDCATKYGNQEEVARGIADAGAQRENLWITGKLWCTAARPENVEAALDEDLRQLNTDYLDLWLMHFPFALNPDNEKLIDDSVTVSETWRAMIKAHKSGKARNIGVSNFTKEHLEQLIEATGVVPAVNQIERHPLLPQDELLAYCKEKDIHVTAFSPLGNNKFNVPKLTEYPEIQELAQKLGRTEAQVLLAWGMQDGVSVISKSITPARVRSNFEAGEVKLGAEEKAAVDEIVRKVGETRYNIPKVKGMDVDVFGTEAEAEATYGVKVV